VAQDRAPLAAGLWLMAGPVAGQVRSVFRLGPISKIPPWGGGAAAAFS